MHQQQRKTKWKRTKRRWIRKREKENIFPENFNRSEKNAYVSFDFQLFNKAHKLNWSSRCLNSAIFFCFAFLHVYLFHEGIHVFVQYTTDNNSTAFESEKEMVIIFHMAYLLLWIFWQRGNFPYVHFNSMHSRNSLLVLLFWVFLKFYFSCI